MSENIRSVEFSYSGHSARGGEINQLFTAKLRERLKPFVFLDHFDVKSEKPWGFPYHPHSGVATFTYTQTADLKHVDTGGHEGVLEKGGVQWMASGGGIWHEEFYQPTNGTVQGLQLWMTLPPELENGDVSYQQVGEPKLPVVGDTRVLTGSYEGEASPIDTPYPFNYFDVQTDKLWKFTPPASHDLAWIYTYGGAVRIEDSEVPARHIAVLESGNSPIEIAPLGDRAEFVIGTAKHSTDNLVVGQFSMHTTKEKLESGLARVRELAHTLKGEGKI